ARATGTARCAARRWAGWTPCGRCSTRCAPWGRPTPATSAPSAATTRPRCGCCCCWGRRRRGRTATTPPGRGAARREPPGRSVYHLRDRLLLDRHPLGRVEEQQQHHGGPQGDARGDEEEGAEVHGLGGGVGEVPLQLAGQEVAGDRPQPEDEDV